MNNDLLIGVYTVSVCFVAVSFITSFRDQFKVTLKDVLVAIMCSFVPIVNTIAAFVLICIWFDKSDNIIIYRKKL